jgi:hypothetical protein
MFRDVHVRLMVGLCSFMFGMTMLFCICKCSIHVVAQVKTKEL